MTTLLAVLNGILFLTVAGVLFQKYRRTRDRGFLWLAIPLVLFPLLGFPLAYALRHVVDRLSAGETIGVYPFTLVESGKMTLGNLVTLLGYFRHAIWSAFVLLGVLMLCRQPPGKATQ